MDAVFPPEPPPGEVTSLRYLHWQLCDNEEVLRFDGPPSPAGKATYWVELCRAHADAGLDGFPVTHQSGRNPAGRCGTVIESRDVDAVLRSHADTWLRPLLAVHIDDHHGDWTATLTRACEQLRQRGADNSSDTYDNVLTAAQTARDYAAADDKRMICAALSLAETLTWTAHRNRLGATRAWS